MCKSTVMKQAHAMCRATIRAGDNYHVTLGACIRAIHAKPSMFDRVKSAVAGINFGGLLVSASIAFVVLLYIALVVANGQVYNDRVADRVADRANAKRMEAIETAIQARDNFEFAQILRKANALQAAHLATYK